MTSPSDDPHGERAYGKEPELPPGVGAYDILPPAMRKGGLPVGTQAQGVVSEAELERLRADLGMLEGLIALLQAERESQREQSAWDEQLLGNAHLDTGIRITAFYLGRELRRRTADRTDEGATPIDVELLAQITGQGRNTVGRHLRALEAMGVITRSIQLVAGKGVSRPSRVKNRRATRKGRKPSTPDPNLVTHQIGGGRRAGVQVSLEIELAFYEPGRWRPQRPAALGERPDQDVGERQG